MDEKKSETKTFPRVLACECAIGVQIRHVVKNGISASKDLKMEFFPSIGTPAGLLIYSNEDPVVGEFIPFANIKQVRVRVG